MNFAKAKLNVAISCISASLLLFGACNDEQEPTKPDAVNLSSELGENGKDVVLSWTKPDETNTSYTYEVISGDSTVTETTELSYTVTGLEFDTEYTFKLTVHNGAVASSDTSETTISTGKYGGGIFITNEGGFGNNNGSVSFYNYKTDQVINNLFSTVNDRALGDVVQSMKLHNDRAYIVVNNSNKIEVVNRFSFEEVGVVEGLSLPRFFTAFEDKGYVTCWGDNSVKVIDLGTLTVTNTIAVGSGPEGLAISGGNLFVANGGGYGVDSTISVIDLQSEEVVSTIAAKYNPKKVVADENGNIWVLVHGKVVYSPDWTQIIEETPSMIYKIDAANATAIETEKLFDTQHPAGLSINGDGASLYVGGGFGFGGIYKVETENIGSSATITKIVDDYAYGFEFDKNSNTLFVGIAPDFTSGGTLLRYNENGEKLGEYTVGIGPNGAGFKGTK